ncbi:unnamed protein product [Absidia cylindrospora]
MLVTWVTIYNKLVLEVDRRVRLAASNIHQLICLRAKKKMAPYLKEFIGAWMMAMFDQSKDVARLARAAFESVFAEDKRQGVIVFCQKEILDYVSEMLLVKTAETLSDKRYVSPDDMAAKYARVMSSSLYAVTYLTESLPNDERIKSLDDYNALFDSPALWKFVTHENPVIRRTLYHLIKILLLHWPDVLESRLDMICPDFYASIFVDKDTSVHVEMWDSLLLMTKQFPDSWIIISKKKPALNKLYNFLRNGLNGSANIAYPSMIVLLANLPLQLQDSPNFYKDVFINFWKGMSSNVIDRSNSHELVNAYTECLVYFAIKKSASDGETTKYLVDVALFDAIKTYLIQTKESATVREKMNDQCGICLAKHMVTLIKSNSQLPLDALWSQMETLCVQTVIDCNGPPGSNVTLSTFCRQVGTLLSCIRQNLQISDISLESDSVYAPITGLVQRLFTAAMESSLVHKEHASDLLTLAYVLLHEYITDVISDIDESKICTQLLSLLSSVPPISVSSVVSVYVTVLSNLSDQAIMEKWWQDILTHVYEMQPADGNVRQMAVLASLLEQIELQKPKMNYQTKTLDDLIQQLAKDILTFSPAHEQGNSQDDQFNRSLLEKVFVRIISLHLDRKLITEDTVCVVLASILSALESFNQHHQTNPTDTIDIDHGSESVMNHITKSVLCIVLGLLEPKDATAVNFLRHSSLSDLPSQVFDIMFINHVDPSAQVAENERQTQADDIISNIQLLASMIWDTMVNLIEISKLSDETLSTNFKQSVLEHVKNSIRNVDCLSSPADSVQRAIKLLSTLYPDICTLEYQLAVTTLVGNNASWENMYSPFQEKRTLEYMASSITDRYAGMDYQSLWEDKDELYPVRYDIYGLSSLGRLALFTVAFIQGQVGLDTFFKTDKVDDRDDRDALMRTLMVISQECKQGLGLIDLSRIWKSQTSIPSASSSSTAATTLPMDVLAVGINNFVQQTNTMFNSWFNLTLENHPQPTSVSNLCVSLSKSIKTGSLIQNSNNNRLLKFAFDSLKSHQIMDSYYASFIQILVDHLVVHDHWTGKQIEEWLPLLKAEEQTVSPLTKCALITSFKSVIGEVAGYRYLQSDFANKLSGSEGLQVFDDRAEAWQWLSLLNASTLHFGSIAIPPQRLMYLLNAIKGWFNQDYDDHLSVIDRNKIHSQLAILFGNISDSIQEVSGSQWDFFLNCIYEWISYNEASDFDSLPLMYNSLHLLSTLLTMAREGNVEVDEAVKEHWNDISVALWSCFIKEKDTALPISLPRQRYQELLADVLEEVPFKVLQAAGNFGDVAHLLDSTNDVLQKRAFFILKKLVNEQANDMSVQMEFTQTDDNETSQCIDQDLFKRLINEPTLSSWDVTSVDEKSLHEILGYLVSWLLMFEHFGDITFKLKQIYTSELKDGGAIDKLMPFLFKILKVGVGQGTSPFDLAPWDCSVYELEGFDIMVDTSYSLLAAHLYYQALKHIPSLARSWWINLKNHVLVSSVEQYTEQHFSGLLISHEMEMMNRPDIKQQLEENDNEFSVRTLKANNEVHATYHVDEEAMQISIKLPSNFPLQQISVEGIQKFGVKDKQWRGWMFAIAAVIGSQNGNIVDALTVFKRNVNLHFEGVGDCVICYSIISVMDRSLPKKQCRTCKNKFHASCLYKWFRSSNSASCPLCRTVF